MHQQKIIRLSNSLSQVYVIIVLLHFLSASITICICCITILLAEGLEMLPFLNYIVAATAQALVYSIGGEVLVDSSNSLMFAAYQVNWYKCDQKIKKTIFFMMLRAAKPIGVNVPFFKISMETFASVS